MSYRHTVHRSIQLTGSRGKNASNLISLKLPCFLSPASRSKLAKSHKFFPQGCYGYSYAHEQRLYPVQCGTTCSVLLFASARMNCFFGHQVRTAPFYFFGILLHPEESPALYVERDLQLAFSVLLHIVIQSSYFLILSYGLRLQCFQLKMVILE